MSKSKRVSLSDIKHGTTIYYVQASGKFSKMYRVVILSRTVTDENGNRMIVGMTTLLEFDFDDYGNLVFSGLPYDESYMRIDDVNIINNQIQGHKCFTSYNKAKKYLKYCINFNITQDYPELIIKSGYQVKVSG